MTTAATPYDPSTAKYTVGASLLKAVGVNLRLGNREILRDVNIEIRDIVRPGYTMGQVVALLGPSGMGKTQLFRILAGLNIPDTGDVFIGEPAKPVRRGLVGVVAQHYPLFTHRKVLGNLRLAGKLAGMTSSQADEKARGFLARFRLEDAADKYPAQLSGGMRQRVAIAQQFMCSERFLLLDEPFSGLDPIQLDNVVKLIREVSEAHEQNTLIVVTHDIQSALRIADTIWILGRDRDANGQIVPGARVQHTYNLIEAGIAWQKDAENMPQLAQIYREIREKFATL